MNDPQISPNDPDFAAQVEARLIQYEEEYSLEKYPSEHRSHLGASAIGEECWRKLWYQFRWIKLGQAPGRMRRLWQRGKDEEAKFEAFLFWAGFHKREIQQPFSKVNGHYGGTPDDCWIIKWANDIKILGEYKTFGSKYFEILKKEKLIKSNPKYYAQLSTYAKEYNVKYVLFYAVNKDNDELYCELVQADYQLAIQLEKKASDIIYSENPPLKINENPAYFKCKMCDFNSICHYNEKIEKNCRSCTHSKPVENSRWFCKKWNNVIPKDFIKTGCDSYEPIC